MDLFIKTYFNILATLGISITVLVLFGISSLLFLFTPSFDV